MNSLRSFEWKARWGLH